MLLWANCSEASHCSLGDGVGRSTYAAKSDYYAASLPPAGIGAALGAIEGRAAAPAAGSILFDAYGGAINRVPPAATAFVHRGMRFSCQYIASWNVGGGDPPAAAAISWLRNTRGSLRPYASGFAYQNYIDADLTGWGPAYYGSNYARLRRIKRRYDPQDVFRFAQSIVRAPA
jgi:FAD/FMN-containing dehydrogenase